MAPVLSRPIDAPRSVDKRWAEVGHRARRRDGEAVDWALGETGAGESGVTPLAPGGCWRPRRMDD